MTDLVRIDAPSRIAAIDDESITVEHVFTEKSVRFSDICPLRGLAVGNVLLEGAVVGVVSSYMTREPVEADSNPSAGNTDKFDRELADWKPLPDDENDRLEELCRRARARGDAERQTGPFPPFDPVAVAVRDVSLAFADLFVAVRRVLKPEEK